MGEAPGAARLRGLVGGIELYIRLRGVAVLVSRDVWRVVSCSRVHTLAAREMCVIVVWRERGGRAIW